MKRWMVEVRATVRRTYFVDAENNKAAIAASCSVSADLEEVENEETMHVSEVPTDDSEQLDTFQRPEGEKS
jgi:hypothetical protein